MRQSCAHTAAGQPSEKAAKMTGILLIHSAWHGPWCWATLPSAWHSAGMIFAYAATIGHRNGSGIASVTMSKTCATRWPNSPARPCSSATPSGAYWHRSIWSAIPGAGLVLMASIALGETIGARLAVRHPMPFLKTNLGLRLRPCIATRSQAQDLFFTPDTPEDVVDRCFVQLQDESYLAFIDSREGPCLGLRCRAERDLHRSRGAGDGTRLPTGAHHLSWHGGHDMMLDSGRPKVVYCVDTWIREHQGAGQVRCEA
jgi:hypothetical protein